MKNFLKVVCDYGEADLLEEIFAAYDVVEAEKNGILQAKLEYVLEPTEDDSSDFLVFAYHVIVLYFCFQDRYNLF